MEEPTVSNISLRGRWQDTIRPNTVALGALQIEDIISEIGNRARKTGLPLLTWDTMRFQHWNADRKGKGIEEATQAVRSMMRLEAEKPLLTLAGPVGVGKTHLAVSIAWAWLEKGYFVTYRHAADMLDELRRSYDYTWDRLPEGQWSYEQLMRRFKTSGLLVIDDLGAEKTTDWGAEHLDTIVDARWINMLPLVVTTNALSRELSPRIADRLMDKQRGTVVTIEAASYRIKP